MKAIPARDIIKTAGAGAAVPAFNIDNLESAIAVCEVLKETGKPVIVQTIPRTLRYGGVKTYPALMDALTDELGVRTPYAMHLDHGDGKELAKKCLDAGFSSVMFDGSALPFAENFEKTMEVVLLAGKYGASVEGELGAIGGKEEGDEELEASYTKIEEAARFSETGVAMLAIGVGTAHGVYAGTPKINVERIKEISKATSVPLVLHGASGLSNEVLRACIGAGIKKINFATELRQAYTLGIKKGMTDNPSCFDPKIYMRTAIDEIKSVLKQKIEICYGL